MIINSGAKTLRFRCDRGATRNSKAYYGGTMLRPALQLICIPPRSNSTEKTNCGNDAAGNAT
jgi:hypothetical protein